MKKLVSLALGAVIAAAAPAIAQAETAQVSRSAEVTYDDLDLGKASGADQLANRVRNAARVVCGVRENTLTDIMAVSKCRTAAVEGARPQMEVVLDRARRGEVEMAENGRKSISVKAAGSR